MNVLEKEKMTRTQEPTSATDASKETFMTMLERLMYANGMNQTEFAAKIHVVPSTVCHWINGRRVPQAKHIRAMADALNVSPMDLTKAIKPESRAYTIQ